MNLKSLCGFFNSSNLLPNGEIKHFCGEISPPVNKLFTIHTISKTWYCEVSVRPGETSRDQTVSHLRGKETSVICACLQRISLLLCAEDQQSKNSPQERARGRIQIHRRFTLRSGSIGASSPNITKEQQDALKSLKEDKSIMILPADKGRASVVLDADTYHAKMSSLIDSGPYQLLNKDPTDRLTRKLSEKLLTLKRNGNISEAVYNKIRPRHKQPPRVYGLPKTHKANTPFRPIVSCVNTFAYDASAFLANILSPLTGNSDFTVTNISSLHIRHQQ